LRVVLIALPEGWHRPAEERTFSIREAVSLFVASLQLFSFAIVIPMHDASGRRDSL
jgi:hypothetical protein